MKHFFTELSHPAGADPGEIVEGCYTVEGGILKLTDAAGQPLGADYSLELGPDDKELAVARMLLRTWARRAARGRRGPIRFSESSRMA